MVLFLSLLKMRRSELVVVLGPTTSGFLVVPLIYSVALYKKSGRTRYTAETAYTLLSKWKGVVSNVASKLSVLLTSSLGEGEGTISGKNFLSTPPNACPPVWSHVRLNTETMCVESYMQPARSSLPA
jgi:hypothetical protein